MRTKNSIINSLVGVLSYIILALGPFFLSPFVAGLGKEVLGIQKTFTDTTALLSIVELGISFGIIYKLYQPIADNDKEKIAVLLNFYKKAFKIIAAIVFSLGLVVAVVIPKLVPEHDADMFSDKWLMAMFMLYVLDTLATYLFGHKRAMLIADQKNYMVNVCMTGCQIFMYILQFISIYFFGSFEFYVLSKVMCTTLDSIFVHVMYKRLYKDINLKTKNKLCKEEKNELFKNLGALFYHKIGYQSLISGSTLVITSKLGQAVTGVYYPYTLVTGGLMSITDQIFRAILSSFGDLLVKATKGQVYSVYRKIFFLNHIIISFFSVSFFCIIVPFIRVWMGEKFLFPVATVVLITANFYMLGMRQSITMVKNSAGLYRPDRYFALLEAFINIVGSLLLVERLGINGILISNIISSLVIPFWTQPYIVYKNVFNRSVVSYYKRYVSYAVTTLISGILSYYLCKVIGPSDGFLKIIVNVLICLIVPNLVNILIFYKTEEFQYLYGILKNIFKKFRMRKS